MSALSLSKMWPYVPSCSIFRCVVAIGGTRSLESVAREVGRRRRIFGVVVGVVYCFWVGGLRTKFLVGLKTLGFFELLVRKDRAGESMSRLL